ncbi:DUF2171 domain-containing protein [Deinococcus pimensis]|uniref:DUF2171 domain-containing protein n=1 Tax=Deinococcus pimensis TaxID=309888 RepID=UPI0004B80870|nr:DUF2171 domain-containing protein [Deinococcus pimensis]
MKPEDIREHLMVHARGSGSMGGAPGVHVGTVDRVEGNYVKLTRNDAPDGRHHWIPLSWVERADERAVYLSKTADEFRQGAMTRNPQEDASSAMGAGSAAASGHVAGGTGTSYGSLTGGATTNSTEDVQSRGADAGTGIFGRLPSEYGGTLDGRDPLSEDVAAGSTGMGSGLASSGGSMLSDREIDRTGADSPMGDRASTGLGNPNAGGTTDTYTAAGVGNTTSDRELMSGAGAASGDFMDRNANTGASGNVSGQDGDEKRHVGQGTRGLNADRDENVAGNVSRGAMEDRDNSNLQGTVQGMEAYDNSYSGGSAAMPSAGGSAATPESTMNTNLDPALAGSDFDRDAMGQAVDNRSDDGAENDEGRHG